jgi:hypothetical protein
MPSINHYTYVNFFAIVLAIFYSSFPTTAQAVVVDNFLVFNSGGEWVDSNHGSNIFTGDGNGTNPLGSQRQLGVQVIVGNPIPHQLSLAYGDININGKGLEISGDASGETPNPNYPDGPPSFPPNQVYWNIEYGPLNFDSTAGGNNRFRLYISSQNSNINVSLSVTDINGLSSYTSEMPVNSNYIDFPYSTFSNNNSSTVDFTSLGDINLHFHAVGPFFGSPIGESVATISSFEIVPEPSIFTILGVGFITLLAITWRRYRLKDAMISEVGVQ